VDYDDYAGDPSVFFDGGAEVIVGGGVPMESYYLQAINAVKDRVVPPLQVLTAIDWTGESVVTVHVAIGNGVSPNSAPAAPAAPTGPAVLLPGEALQFTGSTTDPEDNLLYFQFDWGNGEYSDWIGPVASGADAVLEHGWTEPGNYQVRVKAKDPFGEETAWSGALSVKVGCCQERVGDANDSGDDEPTIGDISAIIAALFILGEESPIASCMAEADVNQSGGINPVFDDITIGDISILIAYLFINGPYDPVTNPSGTVLPSCL